MRDLCASNARLRDGRGLLPATKPNDYQSIPRDGRETIVRAHDNLSPYSARYHTGSGTPLP